MIDSNGIRELLPHRYPFLLVDRVVSVEPGKNIVAYKNVSVNEPFFTGHFPQEPVLPGVLIVEAMAQAAGILGFLSEDKRPSDGYNYLLCGTDKARFKRRVLPGDQLYLYASLITIKRNILKFACEARVDDQLVAASDLLVAEQHIKAGE